MNYSGLSGVIKDLKESEKLKRLKREQALEKQISDFEKLFKIKFLKEEPNQSHISLRGFYSGKEIRISGELRGKHLKILIFDKLNLNIIYKGKFIEGPEHYLSIIKAYNKKEKRSKTGYYKKC